MRKHLKDQEVGLDPYFRYRGKNQTRLETFSDAAFALAITLLVLSSSVPETFQELWLSMRDVIPFGLCVTLIIVIWFQHYYFFLRYGLQNLRIIVLNSFLIFLILVYVYPLKFLSKFLFEIYASLITGNTEAVRFLFEEIVSPRDARLLMMIYGLGASLIFLTLSFMYRNALHTEALDLNAYERYSTRSSMIANLLMAAVPLFSVLIAITGLFGSFNFAISGFIYLLYPPVMIYFGRKVKKQKLKLTDG